MLTTAYILILMGKNFQHEKMRRELKLCISELRHFLDEESYKIDGIRKGNLTIILEGVYIKYLDLISNIEQKIENMGYPYDEREFRIKLNKLYSSTSENVNLRII